MNLKMITQIHHFGCHGLSVDGQGKIAESQGKVREFLFPDPVRTLDFHWKEFNKNYFKPFNIVQMIATHTTECQI